MEKKDLRLSVIGRPDGIVIQCRKCRRTLSTGSAQIRVEVVGDNRAYTLATRHKVWCCDEQKLVSELFDSEEAALSMIGAIERGVEAHGTVALSLLCWGIRRADGSIVPSVPAQPQ